MIQSEWYRLAFGLSLLLNERSLDQLLLFLLLSVLFFIARRVIILEDDRRERKKKEIIKKMWQQQLKENKTHFFTPKNMVRKFIYLCARFFSSQASPKRKSGLFLGEWVTLSGFTPKKILHVDDDDYEPMYKFTNDFFPPRFFSLLSGQHFCIIFCTLK